MWEKALAGATFSALVVSGLTGCTLRRPDTGPVVPTATARPQIEISGTLLLVPAAVGTAYVSVRVQRPGATPSPVLIATVTVNGSPVPWSPAASAYEAAYAGPTGSGSAVTLHVEVPALFSGGATALVPPAVVAISAPVIGSVWGVRTPIPMRWPTPQAGVGYLAVDSESAVRCATVYRGLAAPVAILGPREGGTTLPAYTLCVPTPAPGVSPTPRPALLYVVTAAGVEIPGAGQADPLGKLLHVRDQWVVIRMGGGSLTSIGLVP